MKIKFLLILFLLSSKFTIAAIGLTVPTSASSGVDFNVVATGETTNTFVNHLEIDLIGSTIPSNVYLNQPSHSGYNPSTWKCNIVNTGASSAGVTVKFKLTISGQTGFTYISKQINVAPTPINQTPSFTLSPSSAMIECASSVNKQFIITNNNNTSNVSYEWNLGSSNNGWNYNGQPAPQTINTSGNTLTLSSIVGQVQQSISVLVKINNNLFQTYTCTISMGTTPIQISKPLPTSIFLMFCSPNTANAASVIPSTASSYTWTTTGGYLIDGNPSPYTTSANSVQISNGNSVVNGTLSVIANSPCGSSNAINWDLRYREGLPEIVLGSYMENSVSLYPLSTYNPATTIPITAGANVSFLGATTSNVQIVDASEISGWWTALSPDGGEFHADLYYPNQWLTFRITAENSCGLVTHDVGFYAPPEESWAYAFFPNPTSENLTISYQPDRASSYNVSKTFKRKDFSAKLLDNKGDVLRSSTASNSNKIIFNTLDIPAGTYYLHIIDDKKVIKKQILINH